MILLPIVERELRVAARRGSMYWTRLLVVLGAMLICFWLMLTLPAAAPAASTGMNLFRALSVFAFVYCLFAGIRFTSDSLSVEKREGTLGLLFLTDLKGYDVVLGKLAATSLNAIYRLVAILPVLALPILLGGVTAGDLTRVAVMLLNTLFFSLSAGMFVSSISRVERKAMGGTLLVLFLFLVGPCVLTVLLANAFQLAFPPVFCVLPDPVYACFLALSPLPGVWGGQREFWFSTLILHVIGWGFLALASRIAPEVWKDKPAPPKTAARQERFRDLAQGNPAERKAFRARLLAINPIFWLASRQRQTRWYPWGFLAAMALIFVPPHVALREYGFQGDVAFTMLVTTQVLFKYWVAILASNSFAFDREKGALELILTAPLTIREILRGQWLALRRQFAGPVAAIIVIGLLLLWAAASIRGDDRHYWVTLFAADLLLFPADLLALGLVGTWMGVHSKSAHRAATATIARILLLPWVPLVLLSVLLLFLFFSTTGFTTSWSAVSKVFVALWFWLGILTDLAFGIPAWRGLRRDLRAVAAAAAARTRSKD
jgi:hypothetical protein